VSEASSEDDLPDELGILAVPLNAVFLGAGDNGGFPIDLEGRETELSSIACSMLTNLFSISAKLIDPAGLKR
jgi:hypothetical protein